MVKVRINGTEYKIKTTWQEVDINKLIAFKNDKEEIQNITLIDANNFKQELEFLSDIPREIIDKASEEQLWPLYTLVSFKDDLDAIAQLQALTVSLAPYEQFELAKRHLREGKQYQKVIRVARVYYPEEKITVHLLGLGINIIGQISVFLSKYEDMVKSEPEADEEAAGIESLSGFGAWGTVFVLAGRDVTKVREIFAKPTIEIYTALHYSFREAKYMKRLHEIRYPKTTKP